MRDSILQYCIAFLWLLRIGLVFLRLLIVCCFYFSVSRTHCSIHFPMELVMVSLLPTNEIKPKKVLSVENGSMIFSLFLTELELSGD